MPFDVSHVVVLMMSATVRFRHSINGNFKMSRNVDMEINVDESFSEVEKIIIASGTSNRQVVALAEKVREGVKGLFRINCKIEGKENADWILLDFGAVIVHIFKPEVREYYQIEKMWKGYLTEISS